MCENCNNDETKNNKILNKSNKTKSEKETNSKNSIEISIKELNINE